MARGRHYRIERRLDVRRFKPVNIVVGTLAILLLTISATVFVLSRSSGVKVVDTSENRPITGQVQAAVSSTVVFEEPDYKVSLPRDWYEEERRADRYYDYVKYVSSEDSLTGRSLVIYRNYNRDVPPVTKILPVSLSANGKIRPHSISGQCVDFTHPAVQPQEAVIAKWSNVEFMCNPQPNWNVIGIGTEENGFGVDINGRHYTFIFTDHSSKMENGIFLDALRSFEAK